MPMVWIYRGDSWPVHERLQVMSLEDAKQAESEGWGHRIEGLDGRDVVPWEAGPHEKSDRYRSRMIGARTHPPVTPPPAEPIPPDNPAGGATYGTREMRAPDPFFRRKPGRPKKDEAPWPTES